MSIKFDPKAIDQRIQKEIQYFLKDEPELKADVEYVFRIGMPDRPKAYLMLQFANVLGVKENRIMPFVMVSDLMMAAAMNDDDIIDDNTDRCGEITLWKIKGVNSTIMVTSYMYGLIFSILKRYRPDPTHADFAAYQTSENLLMDYFRIMNIAQYRTTISLKALLNFTVTDLEKLASQKASLLFQFCSAVPAYFAEKFVRELENFGYDLGIARQYISDVQDFMEVPGDNYKNGARMEDYFTHQPNLVLILTGTSDKLSIEEKEWFYSHWTKQIPESEKKTVTIMVVNLISKTGSIDKAREELRRIRMKLETYLKRLPNKEFKEGMSKWAFRSFPMD